MHNFFALSAQHRSGAVNGMPHPVTASAMPLRGLAQWLGMLALFAVLLAVRPAAHAGQADAGRAQVVALAAGDAGKTLVKATVGALYRSSDDGKGWNRIALPAATNGIAAIAASAVRPDLLYVAGPGFGVLRSEDGGRHWLARNDGLPSRKIVALAAHATQADTVYAGVSGAGIFRSQDGGAHWTLMDHGPHDRIVGFVHSNMPGSMQTGWLFVATSNGVQRSMDCFCGWQAAGALKGKVRAVAYDPQQPRRVYAATGKGLFVSTDGGEQWTRTAAPAGTMTALAAAPSGTLYAASGGALFRSTDQGKTWERTGA